jgi:outer membrane murein-binding lipoprotein Lpp
MRMKNLLTATVLGGCLLIGGAVPGFARDRDNKCEQKVRKLEQKLRDTERKHGEHSRQVQKEREQLERERATCRTNDHHDRH